MHGQKIEAYIERAIDSLHHKSLKDAEHWLDEALALDFDALVPKEMLIAIKYWYQRLALIPKSASQFDRCDFIINSWKSFLVYSQKLPKLTERHLFALRICLFRISLDYLYSYSNSDGINNPDVLWRVGLCLKMEGEFDKSRKFLERAVHLHENHSIILSELADVYFLLDREEEGKLLFREACLHQPELLNLDTFESAFLQKLIAEAHAQGFPKNEIPYWLPIIALLKGVLTSTRQLKPAEVGQLKQDIYQLEREFTLQPEKKDSLTPRLLYKYFWLLDHARLVQSPNHVIQDILLKIETLHPKVYKLYTQ